MSEKLCKDCKHCRRNLFVRHEFAKCAAAPNLVDGVPGWLCIIERRPCYDSINECGSQGKLWERRVTLWARIKAMVGAA